MTPPTSQLSTLARVLDVASLRHRVIAQNLANVNTPGFTRLQVAFTDEPAAGSGGAGCSPATRPQVVEDADGPRRADGNNVTLEQEMTDLNKNTLLYTAASQFLASRLATMRSAISGQA